MLRNQNATLLKILFTLFLDFFAFAIVIPVLPVLFSTDELGIFKNDYSSEELKLLYGLLIGAYSIGAIIGAPLLGTISDRIGRRKILLFTNFINFWCYLGMALSSHWINMLLLFIARTLAGAIGASLNTVQAAFADVSTPETKANNLGLTGVAFGIGFILGLSVMVGLSQFNWFSFPLIFTIAALINVLNFCYVLFVFPETLSSPTQKPISIWSGFTNIVKAFKHPRFSILFLTVFMLAVGFALFTQYLQFYLMEEFQFDITQIGLLFMYIGVWVAITQGGLLPIVSKHVSPEKAVWIGLPLFSLTYLLILLPQQAIYFYMVVPIMMILQGILFPTVLAIISNLAHKDMQGEIIGINQSVQSLANALPPILLGFAVSFSITFPMYFGFICTLVAWALYYQFYKRQTNDELQNGR